MSGWGRASGWPWTFLFLSCVSISRKDFFFSCEHQKATVVVSGWGGLPTLRMQRLIKIGWYNVEEIQHHKFYFSLMLIWVFFRISQYQDKNTYTNFLLHQTKSYMIGQMDIDKNFFNRQMEKYFDDHNISRKNENLQK